MADIQNKTIADAYDAFTSELRDTAHSRQDYIQALEEAIYELQMDLDAAREDNARV